MNYINKSEESWKTYSLAITLGREYPEEEFVVRELWLPSSMVEDTGIKVDWSIGSTNVASKKPTMLASVYKPTRESMLCLAMMEKLSPHIEIGSVSVSLVRN